MFTLSIAVGTPRQLRTHPATQHWRALAPVTGEYLPSHGTLLDTLSWNDAVRWNDAFVALTITLPIVGTFATTGDDAGTLTISILDPFDTTGGDAETPYIDLVGTFNELN